jgi:phospholipase D1/2
MICVPFRAENSIIRRLIKFGVRNPSDFISFHSLRNHSVLDSSPITELIYVHSKLMIVDDKTVIIGSANINDRSMLGKRDSEVAVIITDEAFEDGKMNGESFPCGTFAGQLRKSLFKEHLGLVGSTKDVDITDPIIDSFYKDVWLKTSKDNTKIFDDVFKCIPNDNVRSFVTLKKYNDETALYKSKPEEAEKQLKGVNGFLVDLPLNFLCDEILTPSNLSREGIMAANLWT